jgi:hypothetical protein
MSALMLFVAGAFFGFHLLIHILKNKPTPKTSIVFHSFFVIIGMVLVFMARAEGEQGLLSTSLILFSLAAAGGVTMVFLDVVKKSKPPAFLAIGHMLLALSGVICLAIHVFQK